MILLAPEDPNERLRKINAEAPGVPIPRNFDPLTAGDPELDRVGLPRRPDRVAQRELSDVWEELFSPPLTFETTELSYALPLPNNFQSAGATAATARHESSLNWSGAYVTPRDGRMFTDIVAAWNVPDVMVPDGAPPTGEYRSSTWIGLDGQRSYLNSTLPQLGTAQFVNPSDGPVGVVASCWTQWWPAPPLTIKALPVHVGDPMLCWLTVLTPTKVRCIIKNQTGPGPVHRFYMLAPTVIMPPDILTGVQARVSGATAEWVMERPTSLITDELYELPKYGSVEFRHCYAVSALAPGFIGRVEKLLGPTRIKMYRVGTDPHRQVALSRGTRPGDQPGLRVIRTSYV